MNDEMTAKMHDKCIPAIVNLDRGESIDEAPIEKLCDFIAGRFDCADFRMLTVLKLLHAYSRLLSAGTVERMKATVLSFKYWMDEPGEDSMCYWSENHQIIFHTCEYLAGRLYPDDVFTNSGLTGRRHLEKARPKILRWLEYRWLYGFSEWHSNVYYEEDLAPLSLLIDHSGDEETVLKSTIVLDLLLLDMALHSWRGFFSSASGRCYEEQKTDPRKQFTLPVTDLTGGFRNAVEPDFGGLWTLFRLCRNYTIPEVIGDIARDEREIVIRDSMGLDLDEVLREFPKRRDIETTGMFFWGMEAFTTPESIELTMDIYNTWNLGSNRFLADLSPVAGPFLRRARLLPLLVRLLNPVTRGIAIQRGNTYTWKTSGCMLSTAQNHHPGTFGDQQHIWQATLAPDIAVFTTHPACAAFDDPARNFSPSYWVGTGRMPHSAQHRNVSMSIYMIEGRKGFLERELNPFTHAWFPTGRFDAVAHEGRHIAGAYGDVYIALTGKRDLVFRDAERRDLIQRGRETYWICELGTREKWGSFERFVESVKTRAVSFRRRTLTYDAGDRTLGLRYGGDFLVDGKTENTAYPRLDSPYGRAERKPAEIRVELSGKSLRLAFDGMIREERR